MKIKNLSLVLLVVVILVSACGGVTNNATDNNSFPPEDLEQPIDKDNFTRGNVFINSSELFIMESFPVQISLNIIGEMPTPCDLLEYDIHTPNDDGEIVVDLYSLSNPAGTCIQVMEPFEENISIPVDGFPDGNYKLILNGELVGEFSYPG